MAAGKAVIGAIDGETQKIVAEAECGFIGVAESSKHLSECVRKYIVLGDEERQGLGNKSRLYYEEQFSRGKFMDELEEWLRRYVTTN